MDSKNEKSLAAVVQNLAMNLLNRKHICDVCLKGFHQKSHLDKHLLIHSGEDRYKCQSCEKQFSKKEQLNRHIESIHPRLYICDTCHKVFYIKYSFVSHLKVHSNQKPYSCSYCKKTFKMKDYLVHHIKWSCTELPEEDITSGYLAHSSIRITSNRRKYICDICENVYKTKHGLKYHMISHDNVRKIKALTCPICQKLMSHLTSLYVHLKIHRGEVNNRSKKSHTGAESYSCSVCSRKFTRKGDLRRHEMIHSGEKPFSCSKCKTKFTRKNGLNRHMRLHSGHKPFSCTHCSHQFFEKNHIRSHLKRMGIEGTYICSICQKLCPTECSLIRHAEVRHNRKVHFNGKHAKVHEMIEQFACSTCLKRFFDITRLRRHLKIHENPIELNENELIVINGIKADLTSRFLVVVCEKLTQSKICELTSYICPICENLFPTKFLLATHARSHIFVEHWTCSTCYKDFDSQNTLNSHLEIHLKKETTLSPKSEANEDEQTNSMQTSIKNEINEHTTKGFCDNMAMKHEAEDDWYTLFGTSACNLTDDLFTKEEVISSI